MSELFAPVVYRVTETTLDGATRCLLGGWTASYAAHMVNRMIRKADAQIAAGEADPGDVVDVDPESGRIVLRRCHSSFGAREGEVVQRWHTWEMEPVTAPKLTPRAFNDLVALSESVHHPRGDFGKAAVRGGYLRTHKRGAASEVRVDCSGMYSIPPASWRRLVGKGWAGLLTDRVEEWTPVYVSVAGMVALAAYDHQTAVQFRGGLWWVECTCGDFGGHPWFDTEEQAEGALWVHRTERALLALGAGAEQVTQAGRRALKVRAMARA